MWGYVQGCDGPGLAPVSVGDDHVFGFRVHEGVEALNRAVVGYEALGGDGLCSQVVVKDGSVPVDHEPGGVIVE